MPSATAALPDTPVETFSDFYVPQFEVQIESLAVPRNVLRDVTQVTYTDSVDDMDSFEMTVNNWDADLLRFKYSDAHDFDPGKKATLYLGYYGKPLTKMIDAIITGLRPTFPASGQPTLTVTAVNTLIEFRTEPKSRMYPENQGQGRKNITPTEIAEAIAKSLGVGFDAPPPEEQKTEPGVEAIFQHQKYDIVFLMEMARKLNYEVRIDPPKDRNNPKAKPVLSFRPASAVEKVAYELRYGKSLVQFQPNLSTANQVAEVEVIGWDSKKKEEIKGLAKRTPRFGDAFKARRDVITTPPVSSKTEADRLAKAHLEANAQDMVKGTGSTIGLPNLRAGSMVHITGIGARFSGKYFVTGSTHTIGTGGYTTNFDCKLMNDGSVG